MDISVVIPVYNEAKKVPRDIQDAIDYFKNESLKGEIIVSDDGSTDHTKAVVKTLQQQHENLRYLENPHRGKGATVKAGLLEAIGDIILFIDSGGCIPYTDVDRGVKLIQEKQSDIAHASRKLPASKINQSKSLFRRILSKVFRIVIPMYMGIYGRYSDTQCGLKIYKKEVGQKIYKDCITQGFMFDIETIIRGEKYNYTIKEFPIHWFADPDSRLTASNTIMSMFKELKAIKKAV